MKKTIIKIDRLICDRLTEYVRRWIAKHKFEKHKIDLLLKLERIHTGVIFILAAVLPAIWYLIAGQKISASFHFLLWIGFVALHLSGMKLTYNLKGFHDYVFSLRKNPAIYEMEKQSVEQYFITSRRKRIEGFAVVTGLTVFISMLLLSLDAVLHQVSANTLMVGYFLVSNVLSILQRYVLLVFDFDEPTPKEKKQKDSITDIVKREWQRIVEGLSPQPNYGT